MVSLCERNQIDYAIMGGIAVRVHGIPRPTYDVDLEVAIPEERFATFFNEAEASGYEIAPVYRSGWRDTVGSMPLVKMKTYLTAGQSVDVDLFLNETDFQRSVMSRRMAVEFEGKSLWFVTPEDLLLFKLLANRPRDLGDIEDVLFVQGPLDEDYMHHWAAILGITERLKSALNV
jgi:hypothetical protein